MASWWGLGLVARPPRKVGYYEVPGLSSRVRREAAGLQMEPTEPVAASHGAARRDDLRQGGIATLAMLHYISDEKLAPSASSRTVFTRAAPRAAREPLGAPDVAA